MAQNYTRQSSFADGDTITASLFNNEFNQVVNAFSYSASSDSSTGHKHDGTAGQGGNIPKIGDIDFLNKIVVDSTNNRWGIFVEVAGGPVEQVRIQDGAIVPVTTNDIDLGTSALQFKDIFIDGTANIDSLVLSSGSTVTAILDEDDLVSDSATALATQQSIKAYVDAQVTAQDLDIVGDTGTDAIDLDSETLTFTGGTGITSVVTAGTVTHNIDSTVATLTGTQTLTNKSLTAPTLTGTAIVASLDISGDIDVDGTTNLDVVDIDGALTQDGGAVFNEAGADADFRVESSGNANMLFVDGGENAVGIGTIPPAWRAGLADVGFNVGVNAALYDQTGGSVFLVNNWYRADDNTLTYRNTNEAQYMSMEAGEFSFAKTLTSALSLTLTLMLCLCKGLMATWVLVLVCLLTN
jgi:prepilin-type processing-associated H-X9-DG protein